MQAETQRFEKAYQLSQIETELGLCVVVPTRNNVPNFRYEANLQSILQQEYNNYRLVIVDDASTDHTASFIELWLRQSKLPSTRYRLIKNQERISAVPNINMAIKQHCHQDDIAVIVNGDDELLGKKVFQVVNAIYQRHHPGVAYTNHIHGHLDKQDFDKGYSRSYKFTDIKNRNYRLVGQHFGHMRTFLVKLFLEVR